MIHLLIVDRRLYQQWWDIFFLWGPVGMGMSLCGDVDEFQSHEDLYSVDQFPVM